MNLTEGMQRIIHRVTLCLLGLLGLNLFASSVSAQVFDPGPSDSALFDNVINVGPDFGLFLGDVGGDGLTLCSFSAIWEKQL